MSQKETYSERLLRVGLELYGKKFKVPLAKELKIDRTQLWRHLKGEFDGKPTAKDYETILDKLEATVNVQQGDSTELETLKLHLQVLQKQVKKLFDHLDMGKDYEQLKW